MSIIKNKKDAPEFTPVEIEQIKQELRTLYPHVTVREEQLFYKDVATTIEIRLKHKVVDK